MIRRTFSQVHQQSGKLLEREKRLEDKRTQLLAQIQGLTAELEDVNRQLEVIRDQEVRLITQFTADMQPPSMAAPNPPAMSHPIGEPATRIFESASATARISAPNKAASRPTAQASLTDSLEDLRTENTTQTVSADFRDEATLLNISTTFLEAGIGSGSQQQMVGQQGATQRPQNIPQGNQSRKRLRSHGSEDYIDGPGDEPSNPDTQSRALKRPRRAAALKSREACHDMCTQYPEKGGDCDDEEELPDDVAAVVKEESKGDDKTKGGHR